MAEAPESTSDPEGGTAWRIPIGPGWQELLDGPYLGWNWLSPLMEEWTWQHDAPNTQLREVLMLFGDDRLNTWQDPQRAPGCILSALDTAGRDGRRQRMRSGRKADADYAQSMPRNRRIVLATLHAAHGLSSLLYGERAQLIVQARHAGVSWNALAKDLQCSVPTARKAGSHPAAALDRTPWQDSLPMQRYSMLIAVMRDDTDEKLANRTRGPRQLIPRSDRLAWQRNQFLSEGLLEDQLAWVEQPTDQKVLRATLVGVGELLGMTGRVIKQLVYEARHHRRQATWDDVALALGVSVQYAHRKYAETAQWPGSRDVERGLRLDLEYACRVAADRLRSNETPLAQQQAAEEFISNYFFDRQVMDRWRERLDGLWNSE
ncbi:hypothetical protein [Streptomyces luteogriseus]|uniref:hypothetical protein n=1 Tax=Streptomyces luteogriseus TaxID=68233 RepID=UPI003715249E